MLQVLFILFLLFKVQNHGDGNGNRGGNGGKNRHPYRKLPGIFQIGHPRFF